jgi:DNA-directed RNA polymerase beta subunit
VIAYRGSWLDFEFDAKDILHVRIDRRRKMHATVLLRALGYTTKEIMHLYYPVERIEILEDNPQLCRRHFYHSDYLKGSNVVEHQTLKLGEYASQLKEYSSTLKLNAKMMNALEKSAMRTLNLDGLTEISAKRGKGEQRYEQLIETELGDKDIDWRFGHSVTSDDGEYIVEVNQPISLESLFNLRNAGIQNITVFDPSPEVMRQDDVVEVFRAQLKLPMDLNGS